MALPQRSQPSSLTSNWLMLIMNALLWVQTVRTKYIDVCPTPGVTTNCKKIGYDEVGPTPDNMNVVVPSIYRSGKDYTKDVIAPAITGTPTKPINGETSTYTSYSQTVSSKVLVIVPVIIPILAGVPEPPLYIPEGPNDSPPPIETLEPEKATEENGSSSTADKPGQYCTKPTPKAMSAPVSPTSHTTTYGTTPDDGDLSQATPDCNHQGVSNNGYDPDTLKALVEQFCVDGMGSKKATLDGNNLEPKLDPKGISVDLIYNEKTGSCPQSCRDAFADMILSCQFNSHQIIGGAEFSQDCGDYSFMINVKKPTPVQNAGPTPPGEDWPSDLSSTTACWSGSPGKHIHTARASDFISSQCAIVTAGTPAQTTFAVSGFDFSDGETDSRKADISTNLLLYAKGNKDITGGDSCVKGFIGALECPTDSEGTWGGTKWIDDVQWSVWGKDASSKRKGKRDGFADTQAVAENSLSIGSLDAPSPSLHPRENKPREAHVYAYSTCPEAHDCAYGFAIADHYAFSGSACDAEHGEISFNQYASDTALPSSSRTEFKSFGHEGCHLIPGAGTGWGRINCGNQLVGDCKAPDGNQARSFECQGKKAGGVPMGTVLKKMAICSF